VTSPYVRPAPRPDALSLLQDDDDDDDDDGQTPQQVFWCPSAFQPPQAF
jgi:hypothetical protein